MGLIELIEKAQKKPETERKKILAVALILIMSIIVAGWLFAFRAQLRNVGMKEVKEAAAPFSFVKEDIKDFYGFLREFKQNFK